MPAAPTRPPATPTAPTRRRGGYTAPSGPEQVDVELTLEGDTVTAVTVTPHGRPTIRPPDSSSSSPTASPPRWSARTSTRSTCRASPDRRSPAAASTRRSTPSRPRPSSPDRRPAPVGLALRRARHAVARRHRAAGAGCGAGDGRGAHRPLRPRLVALPRRLARGAGSHARPGATDCPMRPAELLGLYGELYEATGGRVSPLVGGALAAARLRPRLAGRARRDPPAGRTRSRGTASTSTPSPLSCSTSARRARASSSTW